LTIGIGATQPVVPALNTALSGPSGMMVCFSSHALRNVARISSSSRSPPGANSCHVEPRMAVIALSSLLRMAATTALAAASAVGKVRS